MAVDRGEKARSRPYGRVASGFHRLTAYRLAVALADEVYARVARWRYPDRVSLGRQLTRAIDSVGANIAEGAGRWHPRDKRQFYVIARGSLYEAEHWLARAEARGLMATGLVERVDEVARALNGLINRPTAR